MSEEVLLLNKENEESTFDHLRDLQLLLKKESAMKEICKE